MYIRLYLSAYEIRCEMFLGLLPCHQRTKRMSLASTLGVTPRVDFLRVETLTDSLGPFYQLEMMFIFPDIRLYN